MEKTAASMAKSQQPRPRPSDLQGVQRHSIAGKISLDDLIARTRLTKPADLTADRVAIAYRAIAW